MSTRARSTAPSQALTRKPASTAGFDVGADLARALPVAHAALDRPGPAGEHRREAVAYDAALVGQLGAEIAYEAAASVVALGQAFAQLPKVAAQPGQGRQAVVAQAAQQGTATVLPVAVESRGASASLLSKWL